MSTRLTDESRHRTKRFRQLRSISKPQYALFGPLLTIVALLTCIWELFYKGTEERVELKRWGMLWWFYYPPPRDTLSDTLSDIYGLVGAISQCICPTVQYVYLHRHAENPIKLSFLPVIFVICLAGSTLLRNRSCNERDETLEHTT
ncbi:unnamed protein product [Prunus armeniaca]